MWQARKTHDLIYSLLQPQEGDVITLRTVTMAINMT